MHSPALLVLCLLVWAPAVGYAQSEQASPPPLDAPTLPPLVTAPDEPEEAPAAEIIPRRYGSAEEPADLRVPRLLLSPILGGVAASCGAVLGLIVSVALLKCDIFDGGCNALEAVMPMLVGGWAAGSLSVYGMSSFLNGQGRLGPTLLGGALGTGMGIALLAASQGVAWYAAPLALGLGAAIGYEISDYSSRSEMKPERDEFAGVQLSPVLGMTARGGVLGGFVGRF